MTKVTAWMSETVIRSDGEDTSTLEPNPTNSIQEKLGRVLIELYDLAVCVASDFQQMHHNFTGCEFDTFHKEILKTYYEEAGNDYDELAEKARMFDCVVPSSTSSATRIGYMANDIMLPCDRCYAIDRTDTILQVLTDNYRMAYNLFNNLEDCSMSIGIANFLQTRLEYWTKEQMYFNRSRKVSVAKDE